MKKNKNSLMDEATTILAHEAADIYNSNARIALSFSKYQDIIESTIDDFGYKGKNFDMKRLPIIIAMALTKLEEKQNATK
jgi:hypothetical protein